MNDDLIPIGTPVRFHNISHFHNQYQENDGAFGVVDGYWKARNGVTYTNVAYPYYVTMSHNGVRLLVSEDELEIVSNEVR